MQNNSTDRLGQRAFTATAMFLLVLAVVIFATSGSIRYWQGWLFLINFAAWSVAFTLYFLKHDPALLERRLRAGPAAESEPLQKRILLFTSICICAIFGVPALDYRMGWSDVPTVVVAIGNVLVAVGFWFIFFVFRENSFASSTIEVSPDQKVIATGPYAIQRHPMYAGALVLFAGVPLALGSWWGLLILQPLTALLVIRLLDEERFQRATCRAAPRSDTG